MFVTLSTLAHAGIIDIIPPMELSREIFDQQRRPRFGNANPERMQLAFWEWMIRGNMPVPTDEENPLAGMIVRDSKLKSAYGPYRARDLFNVPLSRDDGPIWTFDRMGATKTELADGRVLFVAGEHEDFYDPDFYIYNDVVVLEPSGKLAIYGYPKEVFQPTDFHTATVIHNKLFIIGGVGYKEARHVGQTPVYILDLSSYSIAQLQASGDRPGWIHDHEANVDSEGNIVVRGGQIVRERDGKQVFRRNFDDYSLDVCRRIWRRLTSRNWRQFNIRMREGKLFVLDQHPPPEALVPHRAKPSAVPGTQPNVIRFVIDGAPVSLKVGVGEIEVIVEADLPDDASTRLAHEIRENVESAILRGCTIAPM
jgi:hypothetical protein